MKAFVLLAAVFVSSTAFADGFQCVGLTYRQKLEVYNNTQPKLGTRVASIMIASDPKLKVPNQTIATFKRVQGLLSSASTVYVANVDGRFTSVSRKGENIAGTKLGFLKTIRLAIDFSYAHDTPSFAGDKYSAVVKYVKENGEVKSENMVCTRYLKSR